MPQEIQLDKFYTHQLKPAIPAEIVTFDKLKIDVIDNLVDEVQAKVWIEGVEDPYIMSLWNKDTPITYNAIGQWDTSDVIAVVKERLNLQ